MFKIGSSFSVCGREHSARPPATGANRATVFETSTIEKSLGKQSKSDNIWHRLSPAAKPLIGMSHGAAGFAYGLSALAAATGREEFAEAGRECIEFERSGYDAERAERADLGAREPHWRSQWCHGAVGIGLARLGMTKRGAIGSDAVASDIRTALAGADRG